MNKLDEVIKIGYVYKIFTNNKEYIGSTTDFSRRKEEHRKAYSRTNDKSIESKLLYKNMREANGKFFMEIISILKNVTVRELRAEEERWRILFFEKFSRQSSELNMIKCC